MEQPVHRPALVLIGSAGSRRVVALGLVAALVALAPVAQAGPSHPANAYHQTNLVSDLPGLAQLTDPDLVNPWGLAAGPTTPVVGGRQRHRQGHHLPRLRQRQPHQKAPLVVSIPGGAPTGQVFNPTAGFVVHSGAASGPALFLFDSEAGLVTGWNPGVPPPPPSTQAQVGASVPTPSTRAWRIATTPAGTFLYAADFHHGRIDVFDQDFDRVHLSGRFQRPQAARTAMRPSTSRSSAGGCMSPTPSRTPTARTRSPARAAASSTSTAPAATCCAA